VYYIVIKLGNHGKEDVLCKLNNWIKMYKNSKPFSIKSRIMSFKFAFRGIKVLIATQHNTWIHFLGTAFVIVAGLVLKVGKMDWFMLTTAISLVWITEALNTAIEFLVDLVQPDHHPLAEKAKDIAAAAVLIAAIASVVIGVIVFLPKFV
jgi:diacylglycerol kinase